MDNYQVQIGTAATGVHLSPAPFERIVAALRCAVDAMAAGETDEVFAAPPVIARATVERAGYVRSFPHLLGSVHCFGGDRRDWQQLVKLADGGDWHRAQQITDLVLLPAACYHVYPLWTDQVRRLDRPVCVHATCFRQEATDEPGRLRSFRMTEIVRAGQPEECLRWRDEWRDRLAAWLTDLGLTAVAEVADDPFFGPGNRLLREAQRDQQLKWELRVPVADGQPQAVASCNYHLDHFGTAFGITLRGGPAHTACVAFGLDRLVLALYHRHGPDPTEWPDRIHRALQGARIDSTGAR